MPSSMQRETLGSMLGDMRQHTGQQLLSQLADWFKMSVLPGIGLLYLVGAHQPAAVQS